MVHFDSSTLASVLLILSATAAFSGRAAAQRPNNSHAPSAAESAKMDGAEDAANQIVNKLAEDPATENAAKEAHRCFKAWSQTRRKGQVAILEIPANATIGFNGLTTPDTPSPPATNGTPAPQHGGRYWEGTSRWQWTCIEANFLATACDCAVAVVMLHEGWRQEQDVPAVPADNAQRRQVTTNHQNQAAQDLQNIRAARALVICNDPACLAELDKLEANARAALTQENKNAQWLTDHGTPTPQVPPPY